MPGRGRRVALALILLALVLSTGRWGAEFLTERLWEASVAESVAVAGARRALIGLALELSGLLLAIAWLVGHFVIAARRALPDYPPPEREHAHVWPSQLPRWMLTAAAVVVGVLLGGGAGRWVDALLLEVSGARLGVVEPLLGVDLGRFVGAVPLWLALQGRAVLLASAGLLCVVLLHLAGGTIRIAERRLWISPQARGHLAILLPVLAGGPARGSRGPPLAAEFLLRTLVAEIEAGVGAAAALLSLLWWARLRGIAALVVWLIFGLSLLAARVLPLHTEAAVADPGWQAAARGLDSVAFALGPSEAGPAAGRGAATALTPSLWDDTILPAAIADSGALSGTHRGWIVAGGVPRPVWFAVHDLRGQPAELLALADDQVAPAGGVLSWSEGDSIPSPGIRGYRDLSPHALRPRDRRRRRRGRRGAGRMDQAPRAGLGPSASPRVLGP